MKTIVVAGHVCIDITPVFPSGEKETPLSELLAPGRLLHMEGADVHPGGAVSNTGLALKLLGRDVRLLGKTGDDAFGAILRTMFEEYGAGGLITDRNSKTSNTIVLAAPGTDRIFLFTSGANDTFVSADVPDTAFEDAVLFHFGYPPLMRKMYEDQGRELVELFRRAGKHGLATSLDFAEIDPYAETARVDWETILRRVLPHVDFFLPSFEELCFMLDRERYLRLAEKGGDMTEGLDLQAEAAPLAERLIRMGCRVVMVKCGTGGVLYRTCGREQRRSVGQRLPLNPDVWADRQGIQPAFMADRVLSGAGAGDTSIAAFLSAVLDGKSPAECAALAAAEGACCVTEYDTLSGLKPLAELEERIRAGWRTI